MPESSRIENPNRLCRFAGRALKGSQRIFTLTRPKRLPFMNGSSPAKSFRFLLRDRGFTGLRLFDAVLDLVEAGYGADFILIPARRAAGADCADDFASTIIGTAPSITNMFGVTRASKALSV